MWEPVMARLAAEGYRCLAPDQRGYSPGARPADVAAYSHAELGGDIFRLATAAGFERFHLIGHDWGAGAGWCALALPSAPRIASFASLSIPHGKAFAQATWEDPEQEQYRNFIGMIIAGEGPMEGALSADDFAALKGIWSAAHSPAASEAYYRVFSQPGALTAALNWYRATNGHKRILDGSSLDFGPVDLPTLLIWGARDEWVRHKSLDLARPYMRGPYEVMELDAGHWLVQEEADFVTALLLRHLKRHKLSDR